MITEKNKCLRQVVGLVTGWIGPAVDGLFREDDASARRHGWQVEIRRSGMGRAYRDPRFDRFRRCPECEDSGDDENGRRCRGCSGTGRIVLGPTPTPAQARDSDDVI